MIDAELSQALHTAISAGLLVGIAWLYRGYRIDRLRDQLFALRDEAFLYAAQNDLLHHPAHRQLREVFNGMLRYCHRLTFAQLILADRFQPGVASRDPISDWLSLVAALPEDQRNKLIAYHVRMLQIAMRFVIHGSPLGWPLVVRYWLRNITRRRASPHAEASSQILVRRWSRGWQRIERQALET